MSRTHCFILKRMTRTCLAVVTDIREAIGDEKGIVLTGQSAITKDINSASQRDLMKAEAIGLPIAIIVLLFAFGSVMASMVPLIVGVATVISTFGVLAISRRADGLIDFRIEYRPDARACFEHRLFLAFH